MRRNVTFLTGALAVMLVISTRLWAQDRVAQSVIVVVGAPGMPEYLEQFAEWTDLWEQACNKSGTKFRSIGLDGPEETPDRTRLKELLAAESEESNAPLWLVLIGHGTFDGRTARFNLRGPDLTTNDLTEWLEPMQRTVAVIDVSSSSAPFLKALSAPGRVIVTATKSGFEQNYARFGGYLAQAIAEPGADLDKDGQTSLLEAFLTASHQTQAFYLADGRLATEHALLDDNGDGLGTPADWFRGIRPTQKARTGESSFAPTLDGYRAHQLHLLPSETEAAMPTARRAKRDQLELDVMKLRDEKEHLPEAQYYSQLETLLREIAQIYEQVAPSQASN